MPLFTSVNRRIFRNATIVIMLLSITCALCEWSVEEGSAEGAPIVQAGAAICRVLFLPVRPFEPLLNRLDPAVGYFALFGACCFWGLVVERAWATVRGFGRREAASKSA